MAEDPLNDLKGQLIQNLLDENNPKFYELIKGVLNLHKIRAVEVCTYFLNYYIHINYFDSLKTLFREIPEMQPNLDNPGSMDEFLIGSERAFGIILLLSMKYNLNIMLNLEETDQKIDELTSWGPLINRFFIFNTIDPDNYDLELIEILNKVKPYSRINSLLPDLEFDPAYRSVLDCEALKQIYDTSIITDFLDSKPPKGLKFPPERHLFEKYQKTNRFKRIFKIDSSLGISKFTREFFNYAGISILGSKVQIDEIISVFMKYYTNRIPSQKDKIILNLTCFGELLKLVEGKLYVKLRKGNIINRLKEKVSKNKYTVFFEKFCLNSKKIKFPDDFYYFKPRYFLWEYNKFLSYCMYNISGVVYTGLLVIWRGLIKYLESIQKTEEFQDKKGKMLENWCFNKAVEFRLPVEKLIFRNPKLDPSEKYFEMKEQIKDFPNPPLEVNANFPDGSKSSYEEVDLAIKANEYIFLFECKGTATYRGTQDNFLLWIENYNKNIKSLNWKGMLIKTNSKNSYFNELFLQGIKHFIPYHIQTEGIFASDRILSLKGFQGLLAQIRNFIDSGQFGD